MENQSSVLKPSSLETKSASLWQNRAFLLAWIASIFTSLAFSVYLLGESWYVVRKLEMGKSLGIILMITSIPRVLVTLVGGVFADRFKSTRILFLSDMTRCILVFLMAMLLFLHTISFELLMVFALLFGILDAFYWPASSSLLPKIVDQDHLTQANSLFQTTNQLVLLGGPMIGGFVLTCLDGYF